MTAFKFSFYNFVFEVENRYFLYNTLSTALAQIDEQTANAIRNTDIESINVEYHEAMFTQHFIVNSRQNEMDEYLYFYNRTRFGKSSQSFAVNFIPSYSCNLACPYCMQGQNKENKKITLNDIDKIFTFVETTIINANKNDVPILKMYTHLYGGEPMLEKDALYYFVDGIASIGRKHQCENIYSMTSNMTLLDDKMIAFIKKYRISTQVSIDGTKAEHDKRRVLKNGNGTYDMIVNNLCRLKDNNLKDCIVIRLNIDKNNLNAAEEIMQTIYQYSDDIYFGFLDSF
jgi:uncharacterized protein